nr:hypothetical protein [Planobispora longispora]
MVISRSSEVRTTSAATRAGRRAPYQPKVKRAPANRVRITSPQEAITATIAQASRPRTAPRNRVAARSRATTFSAMMAAPNRSVSTR